MSRERRESLLAEYDRSGMSGVRFAQYLGIKYTTLAYWIRSRRRQRQREKLVMKASADTKQAGAMGGGLKRSLIKTVHRLEHHQAPYGSTLPEVLTVSSATQLK
jgi:hypothetical protein